ncbi:MAG: hypothetical protein Q9220_003107 [cf. Caloplaca sp. 1 TL-2023]
MLWNWYTVDSCFISSTWHITSKGMFAGSCIGVVLLACAHQFLTRLQREYDAYLIRQSLAHGIPSNDFSVHRNGSESSQDREIETGKGSSGGSLIASRGLASAETKRLVPTVFQQVVRALIHMVQFAVAYFIMLLAMYYNGYIIICILIGAFLGFFIFSWEGLHLTNP